MTQTHQEKISISDAEIIHLYENGMSQNDIRRQYPVGLRTVRAVLRKAGFDTSSYRRFPVQFEEVLYVLLRAGVFYRKIADVTDISFHVIRDIAERRPGRDQRSAYLHPKVIITEREETFLARYQDGECFCVLCVSLGLSAKEILRCFALLDQDILARHRAALGERLRGEDMSLNTITSVARKYGISSSVVKTYLNS